MKEFKNLKIKIFADGANLGQIKELNKNDWISGFTTNPTLMRSEGVRDYTAFAKEFLKIVPDKPISFEVFADDFEEMEDQAHEIASWGPNVNVKIPIMNTKGQLSIDLINRLLDANIAVNITAVFTLEQVKIILQNLCEKTPCIISVFAGRIADTGKDPCRVMSTILNEIHTQTNVELLWASTREIFNLFQANDVGCHIVTIPSAFLKKMYLIGKDLTEFSLETVKMFYNDAMAAAYEIESKKLTKV